MGSFQMSNRSDFCKELCVSLSSVSDATTLDSVTADIVSLSDLVVLALMEHNDEEITTLYDIVERAHSTLFALSEEKAIAMRQRVVCELRGIVRILAIASTYKNSGLSWF